MSFPPASLVKSRAGARSWVTRAKKALLALVELDDPPRVRLEDAIVEFDRRLASLDEIQTEFELECEDIDVEVEAAADFREEARDVRITAAEILVKMDKLELAERESEESMRTAASSASSSGGATPKPDVRLPKISLPTFSGDVQEWPSFWDQYKSAVHATDLPDISKFTYLRSLLEGDAKACIQGLSLTSHHYSEAIKILKERFGRKEQIIFSHVQQLLSMAVGGKQSGLASLRKLQDSLLSHIRSLECLGISGSQFGVLLTPMVLSILPQDIRMVWARECTGKESDLDCLLQFLDKEIRLREVSNTFRTLKDEKPKDVRKPKHQDEVIYRRTGGPQPSALSLAAVSDKGLCGVCGKHHQIDKCHELQSSCIEDRKSLIWTKGLCFKCLVKGHSYRQCQETCSRCGGPHHILICEQSPSSLQEKKKGTYGKHKRKDKPNPSTPKSEPVLSHMGVCSTPLVTGQTSEVIMQVLRLNIEGRKGHVEANVLFDSGSDRTYASSSLVQKVGAEFCSSESVAYCAFGSRQPKEDLRHLYRFNIGGNGSWATVTATEIPVVCAPIFRRTVPVGIRKELQNLPMAGEYSSNKKLDIDLLIGLDYYWSFLQPDFVPLPGTGLVAQRSIFGYILSGAYADRRPGDNIFTSNISHQLFWVQDVQDSDLRQLWDIDLDPEVMVVNSVLERFEEFIQFHDGRYKVSLPWKSEAKKSQLEDNFGQAKQRSASLSRKLSKQPELRDRYNTVLRDMEKEGIIEEVPSGEFVSKNPTFYMPHRPVVKESSLSTKVRPVFDASAKGAKGISLNDCMETGPNLLPSLVEILLRFCRWPIAIVSDIQKAFLQIVVKPEDRDVHRFLWEIDGQLRVMRLTRVPFGNRASPFILNATIKHHLAQFESTVVTREIQENLYVDNLISGADDDNEAAYMIEEASDIMHTCGMHLTKWGSNRKDVLEEVFSSSEKCVPQTGAKVLGMEWSPEEDSFTFDGVSLDPGLVITKRVVLSLISRLFDPMGFLVPFVINLKCLFQDLWKQGLEWDVEVRAEHSALVLTWIQDLEELKGWRIQRPYLAGPWRDVQSIRLEAFGDASEKAYGACIYIVTVDGKGETSSSLVIAKAKVAPVKKVTLPRLELLGALLAAQLVNFVRKALRLGKDDCRLWSDSTVVLSWISDDASRWKPFVANRVSLIQALTCPSQWFHCPGTQNPADLLTRGLSAGDLKQSQLWLCGPSFISGEMEAEVPCDVAESDVCSERVENTLLNVTPQPEKLFDVDRWGTLVKSLRVVSWVLRFVDNCRKRKRTDPDLTYEEIDRAKAVLLFDVQRQAYGQEISDLRKDNKVSSKSSLYRLSPCLGEDGLLRLKGRLDQAELSYDSKHPIIVPKGHLALLLLRYQHKIMKHAGVGAMLASLRCQYWIINCRRLAKKVKAGCVPCQRVDSRAVVQPVAPLHLNRVQQSLPFATVGIDHGGPLYCVDFPGHKYYILLFTCPSTRAIHLELVNSLNVEDTVLALRRFFSRRGLPGIVWSDNAKTFVAARQQLLQLLGPSSPDWKYIVPRSPWWGGWWERLVRSVKSALKKSLGRKCLTRVELDTVLSEVEACVNSRPLTFVGDCPEDRSPLTPAHFLLGRSSAYERVDRVGTDELSREELLARKGVRDAMLDRFWTLWSDDYLKGLPQWRGPSRENPLCQGDVVLIREDGCPRMGWPMGVVTETFRGKDGVTRACKVRTRAGEYTRSIQRLHYLELHAVDPEIVPTSVSADALVLDPQLDVSDPVVPDAQSDLVDPPVVGNQSDEQVPCPVVSDTVRLSRFGRSVKPVHRLDL